mmetsp:Transcript_68304/g.190600  ORF Transcript_68304/g.190600 Transcript_68304/m.190600 type:complete len:242 (-) Transcript_68304:189-914(-)
MPLAKLLQGVFAGGKLRGDYAEDCKHCSAAVVELPVPHVLGLAERIADAELQRVAEVADRLGALRGVVLPDRELQGASEEKEGGEAVRARRGKHCPQALGHVLEAWKLEGGLGDGADGCHHRDAAVLHLRRPQVAEGGLVADLAETQRVEVSEGLGDSQLLGRIERRRWWWRCLRLGGCFDNGRGCPAHGCRGLGSGNASRKLEGQSPHGAHQRNERRGTLLGRLLRGCTTARCRTSAAKG